MKSLRAPIGGASFLANANAARPPRDTRWRRVLLTRSLGCPRPRAARPVLRPRPSLCRHPRGLRGQRGVLTGGVRPRRPQGRGTRVATRAPGPSQARAGRGRPGKPPPLLGRLLRPHARPCSGGPRKPVEQHRGGTGAGSDLPRLRQRLAALAQPPQEPLAWAPYGPPAASEGQPFQPYAFEAPPGPNWRPQAWQGGCWVPWCRGPWCLPLGDGPRGQPARMSRAGW